MDGAIRMGDIYHGETYDARKESAWTKPGYNTANWNKTAVNPHFKGELIAFAGPTVQVRPHLNRTPLSTTITEVRKMENQCAECYGQTGSHSVKER